MSKDLQFPSWILTAFCLPTDLDKKKLPIVDVGLSAMPQSCDLMNVTSIVPTAFPSVFVSFLPLVVDSGHSPTILWTKSWLLLPEHERRTHFNKFLVDRTLFPHSVIYKPFKQQPESPVVKYA